MSIALSAKQICFLGAGSIAEAMVRGLLQGGKTAPERITLINRGTDRLTLLQERYGVAAALTDEQKRQALGASDVIVLAVKPKDAAAALAAYKGLWSARHLLISVVAGLAIPVIEQLTLTGAQIVRAMPNTSSTIGLGATGVAFSPAVSEANKEIALALFESVGVSAVVEEPLLDIVTGVSGSGPAYVYLLMEAMIRAGVEAGLAAETARGLTIQTVLGAAKMVASTGEQPAALRAKVTSPGGTTQAALEVMNRHEMPETIVKAIHRAAERAQELGDEIKKHALQS
ncbi:MAG TPA: pyrroline-5-carboxylate reductase [Bacilli bacterium]